jgi:hypothetical protein
MQKSISLFLFMAGYSAPKAFGEVVGSSRLYRGPTISTLKIKGLHESAAPFLFSGKTFLLLFSI